MHMQNKNRQLAILSIPLVFVIISIGTSIGSSNIHILDTMSIILNNVFNIPLREGVDPKNISIIWSLRLPRVLLAFMVGGCLAVSGSVVQSILKNELASPYTLGVSSGASLGAGIIIVTGISIPFLGQLTLPVVGFLFGLLTVYGVVVFSSKIDKSMSNNTIILAGMVFSLFVNALLTTLTALFSEDIKSISLWQMGSFSMKGWSYVKALVPFLIIGMIGVLRYTKEMDILTFGEEQAKVVGVETNKIKKYLFIFSAVLTGSAVALSGTIGFVDLIAPHMVRKVFGSKHSYVIPMSFVFGGSLMVITDLISRTIISPAELPVGAITAIIGAPFFAYVYFSKGKK
ncbi:FecCD family ABC transporter permease [Paraclostridium sordellii]|uniref:Iron ABC transporter n=2 Tax=Paraclostridium sordellii TaxID=1505 RepID=A0A0C7EAC2_PARSO|nr:iron ABC transporter permease [Paeniclostridium sordellii]CEN22271.1 iron ABC transporter [[Clostridium] sordellii] [Paeniclostridium sordellii]CEN79061.1 iron ABC transporter [[Clostridium] sordellii] [Paeniclostridium sordellii]CEP88605.1 iron ABC transporter [[Clostridium] sordellii] [Paeniclostridium sordellii]CEP96897.1 iron ABC transporter [[Clostridium] sordellii] [Paeniclostridium sordellii]CEQ00585.1 iron ABC transporter [[Clostridium] sordellii] [Paeniclostridium sordellii]